MCVLFFRVSQSSEGAVESGGSFFIFFVPEDADRLQLFFCSKVSGSCKSLGSFALLPPLLLLLLTQESFKTLREAEGIIQSPVLTQKI